MGHQITVDLDLTGQLCENFEFTGAGNQYLETQPLEGGSIEPDQELFLVVVMSIIAFDMFTTVGMPVVFRLRRRSTSAGPSSEQRKGESNAQAGGTETNRRLTDPPGKGQKTETQRR